MHTNLRLIALRISQALCVVIITGCATSTNSAPNTIVPTQSVVLPTSSKSPNYEANFLNAFTKGPQLLNINLECTLICWNDNTFVPRQTDMIEVYQWFSKISSSPSQGGVKREQKAPQNTIGIGTGAIQLSAFTDDTQPNPLLRTFAIHIFLAPEAVHTLATKKIDNWIPANVVKRAGIPSALTLGEYTKCVYYLMFDWGGGPFNIERLKHFQVGAINLPLALQSED